MMNKTQDILRIKKLMLLKENSEEKNPVDLLWDYINQVDGVEYEPIPSENIKYNKREGYFYFNFYGFKDYLEYFFPESNSEDNLDHWEWALNDPRGYFRDEDRDSEFESEDYYFNSLPNSTKKELVEYLRDNLGLFLEVENENLPMQIQDLFAALGLDEYWIYAYDSSIHEAHLVNFESDFYKNNCERLEKIGLEKILCFEQYRIRPEQLLIMYSTLGNDKLNYDEVIQSYLEKKRIYDGLPEYPHEFFWESWDEKTFQTRYEAEFYYVFKKFKKSIEEFDTKDKKKFVTIFKKVEKLGGWNMWIDTANGDKIMFVDYDPTTEEIRYRFRDKTKSTWQASGGKTKDFQMLVDKIQNLELEF